MFFKTKIKENTKEHRSINIKPYFALAKKSAEISKAELKNLKLKFSKKTTIENDMTIDFDKFFYERNNHSVKNYRKLNKKVCAGVTAFVAVIGITAGIIGNNFTLAYNVVASDGVLGVCATKEDAVSAIEKAQKNLSDINGDDVAELTEAKVGLTIVKKDDVQSERAMEETIVETYDVREDCFGIMFNGKIVAVARTQEDAEAALNSYKAEFTGENIAETTFNGVVSVEAIKEKSTVIKNSAEEIVAELKMPSGNVKTHIVVQGETLSEIAVLYRMDVNGILSLNPGVTPETLQIGQQIQVSDLSPVLKVVTVEYASATEEIPFETITTYDAESYKGTEVVVSEGVNGSKDVNYKIIRENGYEISKTVESENITLEPVTKQLRVGTKEKPKTIATGKFVCPFKGKVTSNYGARWGRNHNGVDLAGATGSAVIASDGGSVIKAGYYGSFGNLVVIDHENGYQTYYAHLSAINVKAGQRVSQGQLIGKVGNTGNSTGPHLHFEIRTQGKPINPRPLINY
ncbi:MAG: peptidoglycan DD-metalloendopeptidase family protein [Clostridia bacterium]|nr:peptidoglycan DD-metalloendopeptidase family protein [Clostridia bacterium]